MKQIIVVLVAVLLIASAAMGQNQTQNEQEKMILVKESDLPATVLEQVRMKQQLQSYGEYAGLGREIGTAVNEGLKAVTEQTAKFAETKVGKFTMFIIAYKVLGTDIVQFTIGIPLLMVGLIIFVWSYYKNCIPRRILVSKDKDGNKKWEMVNDAGSDKDSEKFVHAILCALFLCLCVAIIFA